MKNLIKIGSGILAMGVLMTTGITVFAASDTDTNMDINSANTLISEESTNRRSMGRCNGGFSNMERPELTEDQKAEMEENMKERLADQLEDGNITKEEYDQAISDIAEGKRPMFLGKGKGGFANMERPELTEDQKAEMEENMKERLADQLEDGNITKEEYDQAISDIAEGKRPMFLGKGKGGFGNMERPELTEEQKAEMEENMKERLTEQLENGNITQEEYDQAISDIAEGKKPMFLGKGKGGFCNMERLDFIGDKK